MKFEDVFQIPKNHILRQVDFRQKGTLAQDEHWVHEELDEAGKVVAKYEIWHCTSVGTLKTNSGYKKYDENGKLIKESNDLPI